MSGLARSFLCGLTLTCHGPPKFLGNPPRTFQSVKHKPADGRLSLFRHKAYSPCLILRAPQENCCPRPWSNSRRGAVQSVPLDHPGKRHFNNACCPQANKVFAEAHRTHQNVQYTTADRSAFAFCLFTYFPSLFLGTVNKQSCSVPHGLLISNNIEICKHPPEGYRGLTSPALQTDCPA